jgi:hypothetical protein
MFVVEDSKSRVVALTELDEISKELFEGVSTPTEIQNPIQVRLRQLPPVVEQLCHE